MQTNQSNPEQEHIRFKIVNFRQPMVTASGIFLGFMLNFAANWVGDAFTKYFIRDTILSIFTTISIASLMTVLYRILSMDYPVDNVKAYYRTTLRYFITGISLPFISFILVIIYRLLKNFVLDSNV